MTAPAPTAAPTAAASAAGAPPVLPAPLLSMPPAPAPPGGARRLRRPLLWVALVVLLGVAQSLLVVLTLRYEQARAQERTDDQATAAQGEIRRRAQLLLQGVQGLQTREPGAWPQRAEELMRSLREVGRIERRDAALHIVEVAESPFREPRSTM